jgi:hypothetical protein
MKRTFDQIEGIHSLPIELLIYMVVIGRLSNADITHLAMTNKGYRNVLDNNKEYLRKRGFWTICIKHSIQPGIVDVCYLAIHPDCIIPFGYEKEDGEWEDLLIVYHTFDKSICTSMLMAVYPDTLNVKWHRGYSNNTNNRSPYVGIVGSTIAVILGGSNVLHSVNVSDGQLLEEVDLPCTYTNRWDITQWHRTSPALVIHQALHLHAENDRWLVTKGDKSAIQILAMKVPKNHEIHFNTNHYSSDYLLLGENRLRYAQDYDALYVVRYPDVKERLKISMNADTTFIEGSEAIVQSTIDMYIIDLATSSPSNIVYKDEFELPRYETWHIDGVAANGDILLFNGGVYDNDDDIKSRKWRLAWYTRSIQRWKISILNTTHRDPLHTIKETGVIWAMGGYDIPTMYRYNPDGTVDTMGTLPLTHMGEFAGSFKNTVYVYFE